MSTGKAVAQGGHAMMLAGRDLLDDNPKFSYAVGSQVSRDWQANGIAKVVLACKDLAHLEKLMAKAEAMGLPHAIVTDEGRTEFPEPTVTCGAIGPWDSDEINKITKRLRLY